MTLRSAAVGFLLTLGPLAAVLASHLTFASWIVEEGWGIDPRADNWAVPAFMGASRTYHLLGALILLAYWVFTASLGRGNILRVRSADALLLMSGLLYAASMLLVSINSNPAAGLMALCPRFGITDKSLDFGFDIPTPCEAFANEIYGNAFLGLPLVLLVASAVLRVLASRARAGF